MSDNSKDKLEIVYENILNMIEYRGHTLKSKKISMDNLIAMKDSAEYLMINSESTDGLYVYFLLFETFSNNLKSGEFTKIVKNVQQHYMTGINIMIISAISINVHVKTKIRELLAKYPKMTIDCYTYSLFSMNIPKHALVPLHIKATNEEIEEYCKFIKNDKFNFPRINKTDPVAVWLNLKPGEVVKIVRVSEIVGESTVYRICVDNTL